MGRNWTKRNVLVLAGIIGLITGLVVYSYLPRKAPPVDTAVAQRTIATGVLVTKDMVAMDAVRASDLPGGQPVALDAVIGKVALADIREGAEIDPSQLGPGGLSASLPDGMRAVSVGVDAVISVGGFAQPGDRVDVVATYSHGEQAFTQTILQNVELLAVGPDIQSKSSANGETAQPDRKTATLIVTPSQAQLVTLADNQGKLRLILRNPNDSKQVVIRETAAKPPVTVTPLPPPAPPKQQPIAVGTGTLPVQPMPVRITPAPPTIEVIRGNVKTQEAVNKG
jgi:pilus assembly protein CpaB